MKIKIFKRMTNILSVMLIVCLLSIGALAQDKNEQMTEARKEAKEASRVLSKMMSRPDDFIPKELLERASAIAIIPDVYKGGFIIGGRAGDGVVARRTANGWSVPVYYDMGGTSFGAQIGVKKTDYIMLFMNEGALRDLLDEKVEFGGDLSFAAGPVGRTAGVGTNPSLDAGVLTYSMSEGAFIGATVKGAVLTADNSVNNAIYGMSAKQILANPQSAKQAQNAPEIQEFINTVTKYAGGGKMAAVNNSSNNMKMVKTNFASNKSMNSDSATTRSQQQLAREIRKELLTLPYYSVFDWIDFTVDANGAVTLNGQVTSPPDTKSRAEAYVKDIDGVSRVTNNIEILPLSPNDDRLRNTLYREIYSGPLFRYQVGSLQQIHIIVNNGRVTLKGIVDNQSDKNYAGIKAKTVSGVFEVSNQLMVSDRKNMAR